MERHYGEVYRQTRIEIVPSDTMGDGVLGRAWPSEKHIQIADNVPYHLFWKVLEHEKCHLAHPDWDEYTVRMMTDTLRV